MLAGNIVGTVPASKIPTEKIKDNIVNDSTIINKIAESITNTDIMNSQIVNAGEVNTDVLNADEAYIDYAEIGDANIKKLTVNELKTNGTDGFLSDTNNYIHAQKQFIQWITGTKSGTEQAKDYKDRKLYYIDGTSGDFTLASKKPSLATGTAADTKHILGFCYIHESETERVPKWITFGGKNYLVWGKNINYIKDKAGNINYEGITFEGSLDILFPSGAIKTTTSTPIKFGNGEHTITDITMTVLNQVIQNTFTETTKAEICFKSMNGVQVPCIQLGAGNGTNDKGKSFIYKDDKAFKIEYHSITDDSIFYFSMNDQGPHLQKDDGTGTLTDIPLGGNFKLMVNDAIYTSSAELRAGEGISISNESSTGGKSGIIHIAASGYVTAKFA